MGAWNEESIVDALVKHFGGGKDEEELVELREEIEGSLNLTMGYSGMGDAGVFTADGDEYHIIKDDGEAESIAKEAVKADLEMEPEIFNKDWLESMLDKDGMVQGLAEEDWYNWAEVKEEKTGKDLKEGLYEDEISELRDEISQLEDELETSSEDEKEGIREEINEKKGEIEEWEEEAEKSDYEDDEDYYLTELFNDEWLTEEELVDRHKDGIYNEFDMYFPPEEIMRHIDLDEAAENAILTDGWPHYISSYNGDYEEIDDGYVIFRE